MGIFKANDIRGTYADELNDSDAYKLGRAFVTFLGRKNPSIVVGRDNRLSSPALSKALIKGLVDQGADVVDIGQVDSPGLYFATSYLKRPGIMVTASHNPAEDNGFYLCKEYSESINEKNGLKSIETMCQKGKFNSPNNKGRVFEASITRAYIKHILSFIKSDNLRKIKVVIDAGNGMGAQIAKSIYMKLPILDVYPLYFESDGRYPHHGPDPSKPENLLDLGRAVLAKKADFGISFDGDADRAGFVDENGKVIEGSLVGTLLATHLLRKFKEEKVVYSSTCSRVLPETIEREKGKPLCDKVGHTFIKQRMRKEHALLGIENTGHFMFRDNWYADSGIIASLLMTELYCMHKNKMSELVSPYQIYTKIPEINFRIPNASKVLKDLIPKIKKLKPSSYDTLDGFRANFNSHWISIRASQTEPYLRLVIEGTNKETVDKAKDTFVRIIKS